MTREEELELLIAEQEKDDNTRVLYPEPGHPKGVSIVPLDKVTPEGRRAVSLADRIVGIEYDLEEGDDVGHVVTFLTPQRGHTLVQTEHGTYNGYHNQGCRCARCTRAHTTYVVALQRRARRREQAARPDRTCASPTCNKTFRPVPSTKMYCDKRCADAGAYARKKALRAA